MSNHSFRVKSTAREVFNNIYLFFLDFASFDYREYNGMLALNVFLVLHVPTQLSEDEC